MRVMSEKNLLINRNLAKEQPVNDTKANINKTESVDEFAASFPEWDLLPPAIVVKRVRRNI
ncbi:hypothetical protein bsdtw1_03556 [Clostridium fungisolvens]|uniref:Uncharacterized protein n=2 Tax=Clostridium fungisolvens TaxID=1604897 RepID=A0A6V8SQE6_9CLOT|nr:hypothetical protein bsdtw1_03556 [Clostridium fungisolvens]